MRAASRASRWPLAAVTQPAAPTVRNRQSQTLAFITHLRATNKRLYDRARRRLVAGSERHLSESWRLRVLPAAGAGGGAGLSPAVRTRPHAVRAARCRA